MFLSYLFYFFIFHYFFVFSNVYMVCLGLTGRFTTFPP